MKKLFLLFSSIMFVLMLAFPANAAHHHRHLPGDPVEQVIYPATCEQKGSVMYSYYCDTCGMFLKSVREKTDALGHDWEDATCTEAKTCENCGKTKGKPLGHTLGEAVIEVEYAADCENQGSVKYNYYCDVCGKLLKFDRLKTDALGHDWKEATCTEAKTCNTCGKTEGESLGHTLGEAVIEVEYEPDCENQGSVKYNYYCDVCGKFLKFDRVKTDALGHDWKEATCTEAKTCNTCGKTEGESLGHTLGEAVIEVEYEPDCENQGSVKYNYYCDVCGKFLKFDRVKTDALGHDWKDATCTEAKACNTCGKTEGESLGHKLGDAVIEVEIPASCEEAGVEKHNYYCTECGKFLKFDRVEIPAIGHCWKDATVMESKKCVNCNLKVGDSLFFVELKKTVSYTCNLLKNASKCVFSCLSVCFGR